MVRLKALTFVGVNTLAQQDRNINYLDLGKSLVWFKPIRRILFWHRHDDDKKIEPVIRSRVIFLLSFDSRGNSCNSPSGWKAVWCFRLRLKSLQLSSNLTTNSSRWKDELVVIEFLVTVRNGEHGLIVMMSSVTVWSRTDRWSVCWTLWRQAVRGKHECRQHYSGKTLIFLTNYLTCWDVRCHQSICEHHYCNQNHYTQSKGLTDNRQEDRTHRLGSV